MSTRTTSFRRLAAGVGALALATVGLLGSAAHADPVLGDIDAEATGSITVHKHVEDAASTAGNPAGAPLTGVEFTLQEVLHDGVSVPLATAEGWAAIEDLEPANVPGGSFTLGTVAGSPQVTDVDGEATFDKLGVGLYLVTETGSGPNLIEAPAAPFFVAIPMPAENGLWEYDVDAYPKNVLGDFEPTKTVADPNQEIREGATVDWTITVPVPAADLDYESFSIGDSLSAGLAFDSWVSVSVGDTTLDPETDYTVSADNSTVTLTDPGLAVLNGALTDDGAEVTAVIRTTITDVGVLDNMATVTINGQPGETPEVTTNWGALQITKQDGANDTTLLEGAEFELYRAVGGLCVTDGEPIDTQTTDEDGHARFEFYIGQNEVTTAQVCVVETLAPQGYVLPANPVSGPYTVDAGSETATVEIELDNYQPEGPDLPLTGAAGTMIFTILGLGLIATGGAFALVRRSRSKA